MNRRQALKSAAAATGWMMAAPYLNLGRFRLFAQAAEYSARTIRLMQESLVIDMLSPLTLNWPQQGKWNLDAENFTDADFQRFRESGINVFHVAYGMGGIDPYTTVLEHIATQNSFIAGNDERVLRIDSAADFERARTSGKIGIMIGVQNSSHFRRPDDVNTFHALGQRVSQLTYNSRNLIGNGSTERSDSGLSDFGVRIVQRMNEVGMAVDTSHCGDRTTIDACEVSAKPVLITHSNARALVNGHPRTKPDEAIRAMAKTGGVMGITGVRNFVRHTEPTTIEHYIDHFDYVRDLIGVEHLGIGSDIDLDGYDDMPAEDYAQLKAGYKDSYAFRDKIDIEGIDHPKRMFDVTEGLIRRGYSDDAIRGILGGNFARVLAEIWTK
ncbi:MAG TPA: membrane dipeptidase [Longimicrobiales bacterium]|nr:membrane dipeptidase [Longimicrobiales bacterium]